MRRKLITLTRKHGTGTGRGRGEPEEQFRDALGEDTEDSQDFPKVLEDADQPKEGEPSTSKFEGKTGKPAVQATEGAEAPSEETPPDPNPVDPQPGTSKETPEAPVEAPTKDPTQAPGKEDPTQVPGKAQIALTKYVKDYRAAGKVWLDTVVEQKENAYHTLFDKLQQLGTPHIPNFDQADKDQVFKCIRDRTGRFLTQDEFVLYVETEEEEIERPRYNLTGDAREALQEYYDAVHLLCEAQTNFTKSTQLLEQKIEDKSLFLSIIQQVQLPAVQVQVRMVEEMEKLEGKMYGELTLSQHLPNFRVIYPNITEQTRMMAAYIYFILHEQITGLKPSQTGCATEFRCGMTLFKRLITWKKQPSGPGRSSDVRGGSSRKLEEVAEMEGVTPTKQRKRTTRSTTAAKSAAPVKTSKGRGKGARGKNK